MNILILLFSDLYKFESLQHLTNLDQIASFSNCTPNIELRSDFFSYRTIKIIFLTDYEKRKGLDLIGIFVGLCALQFLR